MYLCPKKDMKQEKKTKQTKPKNYNNNAFSKFMGKCWLKIAGNSPAPFLSNIKIHLASPFNAAASLPFPKDRHIPTRYLLFAESQMRLSVSTSTPQVVVGDPLILHCKVQGATSPVSLRWWHLPPQHPGHRVLVATMEQDGSQSLGSAYQ